MKTKHTKGKWELSEFEDGHLYIYSKEFGAICEIPSHSNYLREEFKANAKLIVAAPEQQEASILLYDLCKMLANIIDFSDFKHIQEKWNKAINAHEQAIKKAIE